MKAALAHGVFLLALFVLGCSQGNGLEKTEAAESIGSSLVPNPVTITLSAPHPLSPIGAVLLGENSALIGINSNVVSGVTVAMGANNGNLQVQTAGLLNDAWSRKQALLLDRVQVRGTLHAASALTGPFDVIQSRDTAPPFDPPSTLSWTVQPPSPPFNSVIVNIAQSVNLAPGNYGQVIVNPRGALTLHTGTYFLTDLNILLQGSVSLDQVNGPVIIYVTNSLQITGTFASLNGAPPDLLIAYLGNLSVIIGPTVADGGGLFGGPFVGAVVAPNALVILNPVGGVHTGFFAARDLQLAPNAKVQYAVPAAIVSVTNSTGQQCAQLLAGSVPQSQLAQFCHGCLFPGDTDRDGVLDCVDGCPTDPKKVSAGMCGCGIDEVDTDGDGVPDCLDKCPNDPNNTDYGQCGCVAGPFPPAAAGTPCTDTACPQSGATCNGAGVCGNRSACSPAMGSKPINNGGTAYWITGPGFGNATSPGDGGILDAGIGGGAGNTQSGAQAACTAKGLTLSRIDSLSENRFITSLISAPIWLGANDIGASGSWRWSAPGTNNGDQFWSGGPTGTPVNSRYSNWGPSAPGSNTCATMLPGTGFWFDVGCGESLGYICEFRTPIIAVAPESPPGQVSSPPPGLRACVPSDAGSATALFRESVQDLMNDRANAQNHVFGGAAANPPPDGSTCPSDNDIDAAAIGKHPDAGEGCGFVPGNLQAPVACRLDSDCPGGQRCRVRQDSPDCNAPDGGVDGPTDADTCPGQAVCGFVTCTPDPNPTCDQIEICDPGTLFDAAPDPGAIPDASPFNPAALFDASIPDARAVYFDPASGSGTQHAWCHLNPQNPNGVVPANQNPAKANGSSSTSAIKFNFEPDLTFNVTPTPLALGQQDMLLAAQASLKAGVTLTKFLGQNYTADIVSAEAALHATRCSVDDNGTMLRVFGLDDIPLSELGIPQFDTAQDFPEFTVKCRNTIQDFTVAANRAKKAFRDAQQLLSQYYSAKSDGGGILANLCSQAGVAAANVPFFPGGNECPVGEPPEVTINRFIDFYQGGGSSGNAVLAQLTKAQMDLNEASGTISSIFSAPNHLSGVGGSGIDLSKTYSLKFANVDENESQTILSVTFPIGPIPMVLQIDVFADYGVQGDFKVDLNFGAFGIFATTSPASQKLAEVTAEVMPHASAGLSAFVGVGFSLGPIGASVGIEGDVTLAEVRVPVFAGAGVDLNVNDDQRQAPSDILPPISVGASGPLGAFAPFGPPKNIGFSVWYNYGIGLDLDNILSGEIDAALRIDFFFFSRTWRSRVARFNGWSKHFDLISGGGDLSVKVTNRSTPQPGIPPSDASTTPVAEGNAAMGSAQEQVPLTLLARLAVPSNFTPPAGITADDIVVGADAGPVVNVDKTKVQQFFYEGLCCTATGPCSPPGDSVNPPCCAGSTCVEPSPGTFGTPTCVALCKDLGQACSLNTDCCNAGLSSVVCGSLGVCAACVGEGSLCHSAADCCAGNPCDNNVCTNTGIR